MGVEGVVLENHRDITVFRWNIINDFTIDEEFSLCNVFESRNHSECSCFTAP